MSLSGQVAVVTGGGDGIGGATSRRLAEEGCKVLVVDINAELVPQPNVHTDSSTAAPSPAPYHFSE